MARQKGLIKLTGTIGDINFYVVNGQGFARKAGGGFNAKAIKNAENMQRVRENGKEFGHASKVKKKILQAFNPFALKGDRNFHGRCMKLFFKLKNLDTSSNRGLRRVGIGFQTAEGKKAFRDFEFSKPQEFMSVLNRKWHYDADSQSLEISAIPSAKCDNLSKITSFRISFFLVDFNFDTLTYQKHLLNQKTLDLQEVLASITLFPPTVISVFHTPIYYLGLEVWDAQQVVVGRGMRVV